MAYLARIKKHSVVSKLSCVVIARNTVGSLSQVADAIVPKNKEH